MSQTTLAIRSRGLRGLGFGILALLIAIWAGISAFSFRIWERPLLFRYWVGSILAVLILGLLFEASFLFDRVSIPQGRVRWRLRGGQHGDRPLSEVRGIERTNTGGARILFGDGAKVVVGARWFRRRDINALIGALEAETSGQP